MLYVLNMKRPVATDFRIGAYLRAIRRPVRVCLLISMFACCIQFVHAQDRLPNRDRSGTTNENPPRQQSSAVAQDQQQELNQGDVIRINTTLVTVPVSVMDRNGKYIPNLHREQFRIYEDGVEQEIAYFAPTDKPFTVALLLDISDSTRFRLKDIQDAAITFIDQLRPDDSVMVVAFDSRVELIASATSDHDALRRAIRGLQTGRGTSLYNAVDKTLNQSLNQVAGRKAIILFTDGVDTTSVGPTYKRNLWDAEESDVLIYTVQYDTSQDFNDQPQGPAGYRLLFPTRVTEGAGGGPGNEMYNRARNYLRGLAEKTGGRYYTANNPRNLTKAFSVISDELRRQYSLGYYPKKSAQAGQRRAIKVYVNQPRVVVRSRTTYISGASGTVMQPVDQKH